jgi:septal ring factor EnvC (AmiA/AmiB activator)
MAEVTQELIYQFLKRMQADIAWLKHSHAETKAELSAVRGTVVSVHQDIHNIYGVLTRQDERLERIENRLELRELAEAQARFEPHP